MSLQPTERKTSTERKSPIAPATFAVALTAIVTALADPTPTPAEDRDGDGGKQERAEERRNPGQSGGGEKTDSDQEMDEEGPNPGQSQSENESDTQHERREERRNPGQSGGEPPAGGELNGTGDSRSNATSGEAESGRNESDPEPTADDRVDRTGAAPSAAADGGGLEAPGLVGIVAGAGLLTGAAFAGRRALRRRMGE